jgi:hypothetical protein
MKKKGKPFHLIILKLLNEKGINPRILLEAKIMKQPPSAPDHL